MYHIRLAQQQDLSTLAEIEIASAQRFVGTGLVDHLLGSSFDQMKLAALVDLAQVWVACIEGDKVVGFSVVSVQGALAYLEEVDVLPAHGRRGLGARLIAAAREWALANGFDLLTLSTFATIQWNAPYYQRLGFHILPVELWSEDIRRLREEETAQGLPVDKRVFMQLDLK